MREGRPNGHPSMNIEASIVPEPFGFQADIGEGRSERAHKEGAAGSHIAENAFAN
jgi:hypothetical protein